MTEDHINMQSFVVDTSVAIQWFISSGEPHVPEAELILEALRDHQIEVFVPELFKYEIGNVFTKGKRLKPSQLLNAFELLYNLPFNYVLMGRELAEKTAEIVEMCDVSYYDASFVAVAHERGTKLITEDIKLFKKTAQYGCIRLVDYPKLDLYSF